jgi:hypothetical protein
MPRCLSTSNAKPKIEGRRVDWNEQRLHCSLGQLILAKRAHRQIQTRPQEAQMFSFAVARYERRSHTMYLTDRRCETTCNYISPVAQNLRSNLSN